MRWAPMRGSGVRGADEEGVWQIQGPGQKSLEEDLDDWNQMKTDVKQV